jgi:GNAT superfamily N-acetyltransferase
MSSALVSYRSAVPDDAWDLICVHHAAVMAGGKGVYSDEVLLAWSPPPDEGRRQRIADLISQNSTICSLAECEATPVGFGIAVPAERWLKALYVHPDYSGKGVGQNLLCSLELQCMSVGVAALAVNASLNAEGFYRRCGYEVIGETVQELSEALSMAAIHMVKPLSRNA